MDTQFKKGVVELCILELLRKEDLYGFAIIDLLASSLNINENTIYPILRRLTEGGYCENYTINSTLGAPRKYYHISVQGINYLEENKEAWLDFVSRVNHILQGGK